MRKIYLSFFLIAALGCFNEVRCQDSLIIANYMSPNGDGVNDNWLVNDTGLTRNYSVEILDSYGMSVFKKASAYGNEFNGRIGNQSLPDGVYYYFFKEGTVVRYKGSITLTR